MDQRSPHLPEGNLELPSDELFGQPQHPIPRALERPVTPRIGPGALAVGAAINLPDQADRRSAEVHDVPAEQRYLTPKLHTELLSTKVMPE
jgi:hypothetical protein